RAFQKRTNEQMRSPEFDRIAGNLLLLGIGRHNRTADEAIMEEAARYFQSSIGIARSQQARSFELKTSIDLARLRRQQGKPAEARAVLEPILSWFTEGFDTPLLRRAQAVLQSV